MIRVIVSKTPLPKPILDPIQEEHAKPGMSVNVELQGAGSFLNLMRKLHEIDTEWVEDAQAFTIYGRK
jgi:hypothetical protein